LISLKIDIHVHTISSDSTATVDDVIKAAKEKGLDGVVVTDHDTIEGAEEAISKKRGLIIIMGEEVTTTNGHILALGISEPIRKGLPPNIAVFRIHKQNGLAVIPHQTFPFVSKIPKKELHKIPIDGIEVFSAATPFAWHYFRRNLKLAGSLGLPMLAGSDSHFAETIGDAYTIVYAENQETTSILNAIKQGRTDVGCQPSKFIYKFKMMKNMGLGLLYSKH
jgi:hypothetical protein